MLEVRQHPAKGRGLFAARLIKGGEVVLEEAPLLLLVAPDYALAACANCLRLVDSSQQPGGKHGTRMANSDTHACPPPWVVAGCTPCTACQQACFCSASCSQAGTATPWVHSPGICRAYQRIAASGLSREDQAALRFLAHALCLRQIQAQDPDQRYQSLLSLAGLPRDEDRSTVGRLLPALTDALGSSPEAPAEELAALLRKEQLNSYGVHAPHGPGGERRLRGSGLYVRAALINHECNPNVARFDGFDAGGVRLRFRAMHDLPAGSELTQSYCPLNWEFEERQRQCREVYGFACNCPRCQTECQALLAGPGSDEDWETDEDVDEDMEEGTSGHAEEEHGTGAGAGASGSDAMQAAVGSDAETLCQLPPNPDEGPLEPAYLQLFLLKFMCPVPHCFGTLAPLAPEQGPSDVLECNVCGGRRTEAQFLQDLEGRG